MRQLPYLENGGIVTVVGIFSSKAVSLSNVAKDIAFVVQRMGYIPRLFTYIMPSYEVKRICDRVIYVMTYSPVWCTHWVLNARDVYRAGTGRPVVFYGTVEGEIKEHLLYEWMKDCVPYVANSYYTKSKLENAGIRVFDVVYHGVNFEEVNIAKRIMKGMRNYIEGKVGGGVIFGAVLSDHPRKGLDRLLQAFAKVREKDKDAKLYLLTSRPVPRIPGVYHDDRFGKYGKVEILALMGAFDYLVIPSYCEGFGLPLIEANAMGTPVIHCNYPPLSEITNDANITIDFVDIQKVDLEEGILYEYHLYKVEDLADAMLEAMDIRRFKKDKYEDMQAKVVEASRKFDVMNVYPRLLEILEKVRRRDVIL